MSIEDAVHQGQERPASPESPAPSEASPLTPQQDYYTSAVRPLLEGLQHSNRADYADVPGYLGSGNTVNAFRIDTPDGSLVVRIIKPALDKEVVTARYTQSLAPAQGRRCMEQFVIGLPEAGVVLTRLVPGRTPDHIDAPLAAATDQQIGELISTVAQGRHDGFVFDGSATNVLYDPEAGFGLIDFSTVEVVGQEHLLSEGETVGDVIAGFGTLNQSEQDAAATVEDCQRIYQILQQRSALITRMQVLAKIQLPEAEHASLDDAINKKLQQINDQMLFYQDPESALRVLQKMRQGANRG